MQFGVLATISGIVCAIAGGTMSNKWKAWGNICAIGLLFGSIFLYVCIVIIGNNEIMTLSWGIYWIGLTCINFNWALVAKIILSVVQPDQKALANAMMNTIGHLLGDATSA